MEKIALRARINAGLCFVVLALLASQLFLPPALGVADDNDFAKLAGRACLGPAPVSGPVLFDYTVLHWRFSRERCYVSPLRTTAELPFRAALALNRLFHSASDFDMRYMGGVYCVFVLLELLTVQRALRSASLVVSVAAQCLWIVISCSAVYVPYFNSFYFDALTLATLTGALAAVGILTLRTRVTGADLMIACAWLALLAGSKGQHCFVALVCLPALWLRRGRPDFPSTLFRLAGTLAVLCGAVLSLGTTSRSYAGEASFDALFYRILPVAPDPAMYLRETGIPVSWARYTGMHAFSPGGPLEDKAVATTFNDWFGPAGLIRLYVKHPRTAWVLARINLDEGSLDRVRMKTGSVEHRLGNYEQRSGRPPQSLSYFFTWWAALKNMLIAGRPLIYLAFIVTVIALLWVLRPAIAGASLLTGIATASLGVEWAVCLLDGVDAGRHLMIFNYLLDLAVCWVLVMAAQRWTGQISAAWRSRL